MNKPSLSIIILNYNSAQLTINCLASIKKTNIDCFESFEIVVLDNNSKKEDYLYLKKSIDYTQAKLFRSKKNIGFGGGNMLAYNFCKKSDYILFLNNDTIIPNDTIAGMVKIMQSDKKIGVSAPQITNEDGEKVYSFEHFKGLRKLILGRSFLERWFPLEFPKRKLEYDHPLVVNQINGSFMLFDRIAFEKVGGFDSSIFLYFEEFDICYRLKKKGYKTVYNPNLSYCHLEGKSTKKSSAIEKESMQSYLHVVRKNYSYYKYNITRLYFIITFIFKPKKWQFIPLLLKGISNAESMIHSQKIQTLDES